MAFLNERTSLDRSVGGCEIVCRALLAIGLVTRLAAIVLLIDISVAIVSTKIPLLLGHGFRGLSLSKLPRYGFWSMMHEARTDFSSGLGCSFAHRWRRQKMVSGCSYRAFKQRLNQLTSIPISRRCESAQVLRVEGA